MKCLSCGYDNKDDATFCSGCGQRLRQKHQLSKKPLIITIILFLIIALFYTIYLSFKSNIRTKKIYGYIKATEQSLSKAELTDEEISDITGIIEKAKEESIKGNYDVAFAEIKKADDLIKEKRKIFEDHKKKMMDTITKKDILDISKKYYEEGLKYFSNQKYNEAISSFNRALTLNPDIIPAYCKRGLSYFFNRDYEKAISDFSRAIEMDLKGSCGDENKGSAYNYRGNAYFSKGKYDMAITDFTKAIELNPNYAYNYNSRGSAYYNSGEYDMAIKDYNMAIKLGPKLAAAYNNRGTAYNAKGEYKKAINDFNKAIELNPDMESAYENRKLSYSKSADTSKKPKTSR